jgi:ADP-ribosylation factor-like protein 2
MDSFFISTETRPLVSRARARAIHREGVGTREMGLLSIIKKVRDARPSPRRRAPVRARSFVRSLTHRPSSRARSQVKAKERELRVLMVGLDNAGKTTIVKRVNGESIDEISPTLGFNIKTMTYGDYSLNVWDVGGQKTLRAYWRNYYEATDGLIWVVDSADSRRMRDCAEALASVLEEEKLAGASVLVFANKRDIRGAMDVDAIADALGLKRLVNRHWHIVGCSAVTGEGLLDGFDWLVNDCAERIYMLA